MLKTNSIKSEVKKLFPKRTIKTEYGKIYLQSLITPNLVFYTDDSDGIMVFFIKEPNRNPIEGVFAENELLDAVLEDNWIWASKDMLYNIACILEDAN